MSPKSRRPIPPPAAAGGAHEFERAVALFRNGRVAEAEALCERIARTDRQPLAALNLLGVIALQTGRPDVAVARFDRALAMRPQDTGLHLNRGRALIGLQNYEAAVACLDKAIALSPDNLDAHNTRGGVLYRLGRFAAALESFGRAVAIAPAFAPAWIGCGSSQMRLGRLPAARESFAKAVELVPGHAEAHYNLGCVLSELGEREAATDSFDQAIALEPRHVQAWNNKAVALAALQRFDAALACHEQSIALNPALADSHVNFGVTLQMLGRHTAARQCYENAVAAAPDNARAHWNLALCALLMGDYRRGWSEFEWRWRYRGVPDHRHEQPRWSGQPLQDKTILLWAEQGLGDSLQFCRYAEAVAKLGAQVVLHVPRPLVGLLAGVPGVLGVVSEDEPPPATDFQCPLMSLPLAFDTVPETIPANIPYLHAPAEKSAAWRQRLGETAGLRVGLVWSGGFRADQPETWEINRRRNIPLDKFALLNIPGISFFSLQKGDEAVAQLKALASWAGPRIADFTAEFADFSDTAAFIDNLDLVVSVDTSTAHLAGAMGKEVWLLNRFDTCWRWLLDRSDSPWYPRLRLFRQPAPGDWDSVAAALRDALRERLESR
jgi:tetratricopeptide (TPR) repeat protein